MPKDISFVAFYHKNNFFSFNALIGAIETEDSLSDIDVYFLKNKEELFLGLNNIVKEYGKIIVGISFFTTQLFEIREMLATLRKKFEKRIFIIAGGPHPSGDPIGTLEMGANIAVVGEGEETLIEILKKIKYDKDVFDTKGIAFFDMNNNYQYTGKRLPIDLNKYPPLPIKNRKFGAIEITRGCPYTCHFCQIPYVFGTHPRHRDIESICKSIRFMKEYNKRDVRFITPNAFSYGSYDGKELNLSKLEELLVKIKEIIAPRGRLFLGSFPSEVRPDYVNEETLDLVKKYAANDNITIGAQSGSQKVLDFCHRNHTVEDVYNAVKLTLKAGLTPRVDFIFGLPRENEEDIENTIQVMSDLVKMGAKINTHSFMPMPNTPFAREKPGKLPKKLLRVIELMNSTGIAWGYWKKQEKLAVEIAKYLNTYRRA